MGIVIGIQYVLSHLILMAALWGGFVVVVQSLSYLILWDPMDCSTPGFPVLHCLLEFAQSLPMVGAPQRNNIIYNISVLEQLVWGQVEEIHTYFH